MLKWDKQPNIGGVREYHTKLWKIFVDKVEAGKIKALPQGRVVEERLWKHYHPDGVLRSNYNITIFEIERDWFNVLTKIGLISLTKKVEGINIKEVIFIVGGDKVSGGRKTGTKIDAMNKITKEFREWLNEVEEVEGFKIRLFVVEVEKDLVKELEKDGKLKKVG